MAVLADRRARYWVLTLDHLPQLFGSTGRFLQEVGTIGQGPGEFQSPVGAFLVPGDSVVILDQMSMRATVIAPDLKSTRTVHFPWFVPSGNAAVSAPSWPNNVFVSSQIRTPEAIGWPLHSVSFAATEAGISRSFGPGSGESRAQHPVQKLQRLTGYVRGHVWSAGLAEYTLSRWTAKGERTAALERRPEWFPGESNVALFRPDVPPPTTLTGIDEDETGLLWIAVRIPAMDWRAAWKPDAVPGQPAYRADQFDMSRLWQTTIEVIDPSNARVVRRTSVPGVAIAMLSERRIAMYSEDERGEPHVRILRLVLKRP